jgi:PST family polysaccharide transporter
MAAQITQIAFSIFLARLLTPAEYGLIGMLTVLSGFATVIGEAGLNSALVYLKDADEETFSTAFWMQLSINLLFTVIFFFGAGWIAGFYGSPVLRPLTQLMSVTFVLQSVGSIQTAILSRHMNFKAIAIATFAAALLSSICALVLALFGMGVWALAWQVISNIVVLLIGTSLATKWRPRLCFSRPIAKKMTGYGTYLLLNNGINYWLRNGDNLLIGRSLGAAPLGIYNRAYTLMLLPLQNISSILGQVMFSTLSRTRDDMVEFRRLYIQSIRLIAIIAFPIMGGLSVLSLPIILVLYGSQWAGAAPILQILSLVGLLQCIIFPVGWIYNSLGYNKDQFRVTLILAPTFFVLIMLGLSYGLLGVTWGYAIWAVISGLLNMHAAGRLIGVTVFHYLALITRKALATAIMMMIVAVAEPTITISLGLVSGLCACAAIGAFAYGAALLALRDPDLSIVVEWARLTTIRALRQTT